MSSRAFPWIVTLAGWLAAPAAAQTLVLQNPPAVAPITPSARTPLQRPARLVVEKVELAAALAELRARSQVPLIFSPSAFPEGRRVSCKCDDRTVGEALDHLL
ncbi:MAG: hypothetical protein HY560_12490, partial [Gemmatimonadetes bacterium]|nr:hypothetical protein [Gemmatimonadota bacterium]